MELDCFSMFQRDTWMFVFVFGCKNICFFLCKVFFVFLKNVLLINL